MSLLKPSTILSGCVARGRGEGASFTRLAWVRQQFIEQLGIDPIYKVKISYILIIRSSDIR